MNTVVREYSCACPLCKRHARIEQAKLDLNTETLDALVDELHNHLIHAEMDRSYYRAILDGSWPQSVEILERALAKARPKPRWQAGKVPAGTTGRTKVFIRPGLMIGLEDGGRCAETVAWRAA